jgi:hypothetical protein
MTCRTFRFVPEDDEDFRVFDDLLLFFAAITLQSRASRVET